MVFKPKNKKEESIEEDAEAKIKRLNEETRELEEQIEQEKGDVQEPEIADNKELSKQEMRDMIEGHLNRALGLLRYL